MPGQAAISAQQHSVGRDGTGRAGDLTGVAAVAAGQHPHVLPLVLLARHVAEEGGEPMERTESGDVGDVVPPVLGQAAAGGQGLQGQLHRNEAVLVRLRYAVQCRQYFLFNVLAIGIRRGDEQRYRPSVPAERDGQHRLGLGHDHDCAGVRKIVRNAEVEPWQVVIIELRIEQAVLAQGVDVISQSIEMIDRYRPGEQPVALHLPFERKLFQMLSSRGA